MTAKSPAESPATPPALSYPDTGSHDTPSGVQRDAGAVCATVAADDHPAVKADPSISATEAAERLRWAAYIIDCPDGCECAHYRAAWLLRHAADQIDPPKENR